MAKILSNKVVYSGAVFNINEKEIKLDNLVKPIKRQVMLTTNSVTIALVNSKQQVLIESEYRCGINRTSWALPAGRMDIKKEESIKTAQRELAEETGYQIDLNCINHVDTVTLSNGIMNEHSYIFIAKLKEGYYKKVPTQFDGDEMINNYNWVDINKGLKVTDGAASHLALYILKDKINEK